MIFRILLAASCMSAIYLLPLSQARADSATLTRDINSLTQPFAGSFGFCAEVVGGGQPFSFCINGDKQYSMASTYKVPIAWAFLHVAPHLNMSLDSQVDLLPNEMRNHPKPPFVIPPGQAKLTVTIRELIDGMIQYSDNTAADKLIRLVGGAAPITKFLRSKGIAGTRVDRTELHIAFDANGMGQVPADERCTLAEYAAKRDAIPKAKRDKALHAFAKDPRDTTTPLSMVFLLKTLQQSASKGELDAQFVVNSMAQTPTVRLGANLPEGTKVAHKTGTNDIAYNDVGYVTLPNGRMLIVAAFTMSFSADEKVRKELIAKATRRVYDEVTATAPH